MAVKSNYSQKTSLTNSLSEEGFVIGPKLRVNYSLNLGGEKYGGFLVLCGC